MRENLQNKDEMLRPKQASRFLNISPSTMARWRSHGLGPRYYKLETGSILYSKECLIEFVNSCG